MDILAALDEMKSMKSRHATVSLDEMLAALQRTSADKEKRLEEDENLIKKIFHKSEGYVIRIKDDDDDSDDGGGGDPAEPSGESLGDTSKKRKISKELPANPRDSLVTAGIDDKSSNKGKQNVPRSIGRVLVKKPAAQNYPVKVEESKKQEEGKIAEAGLQSLFQSYGSDDDGDE